MKCNLIVASLNPPNPGEVRFVRALARESVEWLIRRQFDISRCDQHGAEVEKMLGQLGLRHLMDKEFVSLYAFTTLTWKYFKRQTEGMSGGTGIVVALNPAELLNAGEVWVFNGDIQNLACNCSSNEWWHQRYVGDMQGLARALDSLVPPSRDSLGRRIHGLVAEARLFAQLTPDHIEQISCGKADGKYLAEQLEELCVAGA
jgi:hypothetical protein